MTQERTENEINLVDYLKVILRKKKVLLGAVLLFAILGGAFVYSSPKVYVTQTTLSVGKSNPNDISLVSLLEDPFLLAQKINRGVYGKFYGILAKNLAGSGFIDIEITSRDPKAAEADLDKVNSLILAEHSNIISEKKDEAQKQIAELNKYVNLLAARNQPTGEIYLRIYDIESRPGNFQPTVVLKNPVSVLKVKVNLPVAVILGGAIGFLVGLFLVFGLVWWQKNKNEFK